MLWLAKFKGVWLGGFMIVRAVSTQQAKETTIYALNKRGLTDRDDSIEISEVQLDSDGAMMIWNGDY